MGPDTSHSGGRPMHLDDIDLGIIVSLRRSPRMSASELARRLTVARGTIHSRLARLEDRAIITGFGPDVDPRAGGHDVLAFVSLEIAQGSHEAVVTHLRSIIEVLEVHTVTGAGDILCRVVATSNDHLHEIIQQMVATSDILRTRTNLALSTTVQRTFADLLVEQQRGRVEG